MPAVGINGQSFLVKENMTILEIALEQDILIPALCYDGEVSPGGRCKLCVVELISDPQKNHLVLACTYKVKRDIDVATNSQDVLKSRRKAMAELFRRAPHAPRIEEMARRIGIGAEPVDSEGSGCILCGLCVRACKEVVGRGAISFKKKGQGDTEIQVDSDRCIACGTCVYICPCGYIKMEDYADARIIWGKVFKKKDHLISGKYFPPLDRIRYIAEQVGLKSEEIDARCAEVNAHRLTGQCIF